MFRDKSQAVCELTLSCQGAGGKRRLIPARSDGFDLRILNSKFDLGILWNVNENDERCLNPLTWDPLGGVRRFRLNSRVLLDEGCTTFGPRVNCVRQVDFRWKRRHLIRTSICDKYSGSMKITTHLDHVRHCETTSGSDWLNR